MNPKLGQELLHSIAGLKEEQAKLRAQKKKVTKDLRNAEKKTRLQKKARQLSDKDLVTVLQMRKAVAANTAEEKCAKAAEEKATNAAGEGN